MMIISRDNPREGGILSSVQQLQRDLAGNAMKVHLLHKFSASKRINVFHYYMFHGKVSRKGIAYPEDPSHSPSDLLDPLCLSRNGRLIPEVFLPATNLVVSSSVRKELELLTNITLLEVAFTKLVDYNYQAGDFSYYHRPEFRKHPEKEDPETLIERLLDAPQLHWTVGQYYEVVVPWLDDILDCYSDHKVTVFHANPFGFNERFELLLSERLLEEYTIVRAQPGLILNVSTFEILAPHIDWDYFASVEVELGTSK